MATAKKIIGRPVDAKNLTLREHRFKAQAAVLKAENEVLKAKLQVAKVKSQEDAARIKKLTAAG